MLHDLPISAASYDDLPDVAQLHVASWKQTYVGQVPQAYLDNLDVSARLRAWQEQFPNRDVSGLLVARVNNKTAGFVCFGRGRDEDRQDCGEIYAIYGVVVSATACIRVRVAGFETKAFKEPTYGCSTRTIGLLRRMNDGAV